MITPNPLQLMLLGVLLVLPGCASNTADLEFKKVHLMEPPYLITYHPVEGSHKLILDQTSRIQGETVLYAKCAYHNQYEIAIIASIERMEEFKRHKELYGGEAHPLAVRQGPVILTVFAARGG